MHPHAGRTLALAIRGRCIFVHTVAKYTHGTVDPRSRRMPARTAVLLAPLI